ncbi:hypothetical protein BDV93DRAFT_123165 [Ceratobasidium sp. AG-I]|nr:hypothetical protein BDV93DRAFT_123165 [Ceratobasidium sp. AG-I]
MWICRWDQFRPNGIRLIHDRPRKQRKPSRKQRKQLPSRPPPTLKRTLKPPLRPNPPRPSQRHLLPKASLRSLRKPPSPKRLLLKTKMTITWTSPT